MIRKRLQLLLFLGLFAVLPIHAQPAPENTDGQEKTNTVDAPDQGENISVDIQWSPVPNVSRYRLEIRGPGGKLLTEKETKDTKVTIDLPPGEYEKRLGLINKFNKLYLWTDWNPLRIIRVLEPELDVATAVEPIQRGSGRRRNITLKPKGDMPQTKYYLLDPEGKTRSVNVIRKGDEIILDIDPDTLPPGEYDLVMENPEGKRDTKRRMLTVEPSVAEKAEIQKDKQYDRQWNKLTASVLVPGLAQRDRGDKLKGNSLLISFFGTLAFTGYSYKQADATYRRLNSDATYNLFKDSTTVSLLGSQLASNQALYFSALASYDRWQADTQAYNRYRLYYYAGATLAAGLYAYHIVDVYRFDIRMNRTAYGDPALSTGISWTF